MNAENTLPETRPPYGWATKRSTSVQETYTHIIILRRTNGPTDHPLSFYGLLSAEMSYCLRNIILYFVFILYYIDCHHNIIYAILHLYTCALCHTWDRNFVIKLYRLAPPIYVGILRFRRRRSFLKFQRKFPDKTKNTLFLYRPYSSWLNGKGIYRLTYKVL